MVPRRASWVFGLSCLSFVAVTACSEEADTRPPELTPPPATAGSGGSASTTGAGGAGGEAPFAITSDAFVEGGTIPTPHECGPPLAPDGPGENVTPDLSWTPGPEGTQSYAVVVRDRDAMIPQFPEGIIHWVIYDIPATVTTLPEGLAPGYEVTDPSGARQAELQGSGYFGYFGPCSPSSMNSYEFTVHAMGEPVLNVTETTSESDIAALVESTSLASTSLTGES